VKASVVEHPMNAGPLVGTSKPGVASITATDIWSALFTIEHSPVSPSPKVLGGTLVFRGTRVPAQTLLDDGLSLDEFLKFAPSIRREGARDFLTLSRGTKP
jgi:uncharacterized protein (DUF433 family)